MATETRLTMSMRQLSSNQLRCMRWKPPLALPLHKACIPRWVPGSCKFFLWKCRAQGAESLAAGASPDTAVVHVAVIENGESISGVESKLSTTNAADRRPSPLTRGGTLRGDKAAGKDPGLMALGKVPVGIGLNCGAFQDVRWKAGNWDLAQFTAPNGKVDWDAVIDAEVLRRKQLEENPEAALNEDPVAFKTTDIPWCMWTRRFHLPEAELLNGRAAMIGLFIGYSVESLTGVGLVDQTNSLVGKLLLLVCVLGVLLIRKNEDVENLKQLAQEWTNYDKQWQSSWQDEQATSLKTKE